MRRLLSGVPEVIRAPDRSDHQALLRFNHRSPTYLQKTQNKEEGNIKKLPFSSPSPYATSLMDIGDS